MGYYTALQTQWATLPAGDTTEQKLAAINAMTVAGPNVDVPVSTVVAYLGLAGKLAALQSFAASPPAGDTNTAAITAAKELVAVMNSPNAPGFQMSNATVFAAIQGMLNSLAGDANTGITATDVTNLLAKAATTIPWWQSAGYSSPISLNDTQAAGLS